MSKENIEIINNEYPIVFKSVPIKLIINKSGIIRQLAIMPTKSQAIEYFKNFPLFMKICIWSIFIFSLFTSAISNSITSCLVRSTILPSLFVIVRSNNPTPEIIATGVIQACKNLIKSDDGSIYSFSINCLFIRYVNEMNNSNNSLQI